MFQHGVINKSNFLILRNFQIILIADTTPGEPIVPVLPFPRWPPSCCLTIAGCDNATLSKYCPQCPDVCREINQCECYFPGTKEIIKPRPIDETPRPPFCPECTQRKCKNNCPHILKECTVDNARAFIAL